ncbi:hypothetical protein [Variovorax sp. dw_954]|uniref:hypothetical protein n=1 Tax=Variovorax sp. dw_954 TaxID=2720078 RepID=UPI001BD6652C|nr:hypothetical protein [Variovorax sp. dw_954]
MSCTGTPDCACGCCAGVSVQTPRGEDNPPGLSAIAYRTGTWATFRETMLARLSSADYPALARLKTRSTDDFSIALLDAGAVVLDILTFYQERLANESYLRTATQRDSLAYLGRLIGYQPAPGVSASTWLAFTVRAAIGLPTDPSTTAITIPAGSRAQSVPAQGATPQTFETSRDILAKPDWNALPVRAGVAWLPSTGQTQAWLAGTATQLHPGDAILVVGDEHLQVSTSTHWDLRIVTAVTTDTVNQRTLVTWAGGLGGGTSAPAHRHSMFLALRQRASLFGYNALDPRMLAPLTLGALQTSQVVSSGDLPEWNFGRDNATGDDLWALNLLDLDAAYSKIVPDSWLVVATPDGNVTRSPAGALTLYQAKAVSNVSRSDYAGSAKISRITVDLGQDLQAAYQATRRVTVYAQSEELATTDKPLACPLYGAFVDLDVIRDDLAGVVAIAVQGKSQKLTANHLANGLRFVPDDGSDPVLVAMGDMFAVARPPAFFTAGGEIPDWTGATASFTLAVIDANGRSGTLAARLVQFDLTPSDKNDPVVQEFAEIAQVLVAATGGPHTRLVLKNPLVSCYERAVTTINANVGPATAGSSVTELLGSGSAVTPNQVFVLKQAPLTYVGAATPTGRQSSLAVRVGGVTWDAVASLYGAAPTASVYTSTDLGGGATRVTFGDGVEGATLPTGQNNISATYRVGLGAASNVGVGAITTLVDRPVGVSDVTNPMAATGGQDAQSVEDIRANAPLSVMTLGRAVSLEDFERFAAAFAGISKAQADWIPAGPYRGVLLTLAGACGAAMPLGDPTRARLVAALAAASSGNVVVWPQSFLETWFRVGAQVCYDSRYDAAVVEAAVRALLQRTYCFAARGFGQGVSRDEIAALIQGVAGVVAVDVTQLDVVATSTAGDLGSAAWSVSAFNAWMSGALATALPRPCSDGMQSICPYRPRVTPGTLPLPAEILVLAPDPKKLVLGVLT